MQVTRRDQLSTGAVVLYKRKLREGKGEKGRSFFFSRALPGEFVFGFMAGAWSDIFLCLAFMLVFFCPKNREILSVQYKMYKSCIKSTNLMTNRMYTIMSVKSQE